MESVHSIITGLCFSEVWVKLSDKQKISYWIQMDRSLLLVQWMCSSSLDLEHFLSLLLTNRWRFIGGNGGIWFYLILMFALVIIVDNR